MSSKVIVTRAALPEGGAVIVSRDSLPGAPGRPGDDGADGREVELSKSSTHVQWRYVGDPSWVALVPLSELTGPAGQDGTNGQDGTDGLNGQDGTDGTDGVDGQDGISVELQKSATHVQWRPIGSPTWINLVPLADLRGPQGDPGNDGTDGVDGQDGAPGDPATATTDAGDLTTGTLDDARLSGNVVLTDDARLSDARTPTAHGHTLDEVTDTATRLALLPAERTKLTGINAGATVNSTDAALRDRSTHTGTQPSTSISDFTEAVQDALAVFFNVTGATFSYNDAGNEMVVTVPPDTNTTDPEVVRDAIGAAMVGLGNITVSVNDAADTITITTTATVNSTDAALRDRSTHTGTQAADTITETSTVKMMTSSERTKLSGIATGATNTPVPRDSVTFGKSGNLAVTTDTTTTKWYNVTGRTLTIIGVHANVLTAPTGAAIRVDVHKNGTTIFTDQTKRVNIAVSTTADASDAPDVTTIADGEYLTVNIDAIGTTITGADITVIIVLEG